MDSRKESSSIRKVIFDTDILIWYFRGDESAKAFLANFPFQSRTISSLTLMELIQGALSKAELRTIKKFIEENFSEVFHPNEAVSRRAIILLERYALSHCLTTVDALLAATVLVFKNKLATANAKHFRFIKGLEVISFVPASLG